MKKFSLNALIDYIFITIGSFIMAVGIGVFLVDAQVVPGGVSGLAMAFHYLSGNSIPVGLLMWAFNVPLFIWGIKVLGKSFGARTFYGFTTNAFFIDLLRGAYIPSIRWQDSDTIQYLLKNDFFFLILLGAVFLGVGLGIIFKFKGTTAGSDIVAAIGQKKWGMMPGQVIMFTDFFVISFAGIIIQLKGLAVQAPAIALTLYAFMLLFISSRLVDIIIDGFDYARSAYIISDKHYAISNQIMYKLSRGATTLQGKGLYRNQQRDIVFTVVNRKEVQILRDIVEEIDPNAFIILNTVHEVMGNGFKRRGQVNIEGFVKKMIKPSKNHIENNDAQSNIESE
ncbi:MAG: YitT family protein [Calditrichia bacterium]|nr:YitT family protein [Calditrichia bacterium]